MRRIKWPRWPRGRYNGRRIVGVELKIIIDLSYWYWKPVQVKYGGGDHWLYFRTFIQWSYD
jgi:hypothetical protein